MSKRCVKELASSPALRSGARCGAMVVSPRDRFFSHGRPRDKLQRLRRHVSVSRHRTSVLPRAQPHAAQALPRLPRQAQDRVPRRRRRWSRRRAAWSGRRSGWSRRPWRASGWSRRSTRLPLRWTRRRRPRTAGRSRRRQQLRSWTRRRGPAWPQPLTLAARRASLVMAQLLLVVRARRVTITPAPTARPKRRRPSGVGRSRPSRARPPRVTPRARRVPVGSSTPRRRSARREPSSPAAEAAPPAAPRDPKNPRDGGRRAAAVREEKPRFSVTCQECGTQAEVPFKPIDGRQIFCQPCYRARKGTAAGGDRRRGHRRPATRASSSKREARTSGLALDSSASRRVVCTDAGRAIRATPCRAQRRARRPRTRRNRRRAPRNRRAPGRPPRRLA